MRNSATKQIAELVQGDTSRRVGFIGPAGSMLFTSLHLPVTRPHAAVLVCSSVYADFTKLYRSEFLLASALAEAGFAVLRFHYRGQGHSDGDTSETSADSMLEDVQIAAEYLRIESGVPRLGFVGCRMGALVATLAASQHDAPLTLWQPVLDGSAYLREALRARRIAGMNRDGSEGSDDSLRSFREAGFVDLYGYPIYSRLVESITSDAVKDSAPRSALLVQVDRRPTLSPAYSGLLEKWRERGCDVESHCVVGDIAWWYRGARQGREGTDSATEAAVAMTIDWTRRRLSLRVPT